MIALQGSTISQIINSDFKDVVNLDERSLKKYTSRLVSAGNKRVRRLLKQGLSITSSTYEDKPFSVRGLNHEIGDTKSSLLKEFSKLKRFLQTKTTTVREYKKWQKTVVSDIVKGVDSKEFFDMYKELYKEGRIFEKFKYNTYDEIRTTLTEGKSKDKDLIKKRVLENLLKDTNNRKEVTAYLEEIKGTNVPTFTDFRKKH